MQSRDQKFAADLTFWTTVAIGTLVCIGTIQALNLHRFWAEVVMGIIVGIVWIILICLSCYPEYCKNLKIVSWFRDGEPAPTICATIACSAFFAIAITLSLTHSLWAQIPVTLVASFILIPLADVLVDP